MFKFCVNVASDADVGTHIAVGAEPFQSLLGSHGGITEPLWGVQEVSKFLGVPVKTLYQWKWRGVGPPVRKVGKHLRYVPARVHAWVDSGESCAA